MSWRRSTFQKDPDSVEPQGFDWTDYLALLGTGVTIADSEWFVSTITDDDSPLALDDDSILSGSLRTQVFLSDGTPGAKYTVTNRITTNSTPPVIDDRSFYVKVKEK